MSMLDVVGYIRATGSMKPPTGEPFAGVTFDANGFSTHPVTRRQYERVAAIIGAEILSQETPSQTQTPEALRQARERVFFSQREFSGALHRLVGDAIGAVTQPRVSRWENGREDIPSEVWDVLSKIIASG